MRIYQSHRHFVVRVTGKPVAVEKLCLGVESFPKSFDQAVDLGLCRPVTGDGIRAGKARHVLSKAMAGDKSVKVACVHIETGQVVPTTHIFARSGYSRDLPEHFQHPVIVKVKKARVVLVKLLFHRPVEQFDVSVRECR